MQPETYVILLVTLGTRDEAERMGEGLVDAGLAARGSVIPTIHSFYREDGRLLLGSEAELVGSRKLPKLGPEPIDPDFKAVDLYHRLQGRKAPLKLLLLDQAVVAGVGNIYADESCFRARVRPDRPAGRLSRPRTARLHAALRDSLLEGILNRGSSVADYVDARGAKGRQQEVLLVYGRGGEPCFKCGRPLAAIRLGGRMTVFCRTCQR